MVYYSAGLCPHCSKKLNYHSKKREIKKFKKLRRRSRYIDAGGNAAKHEAEETSSSVSVVSDELPDHATSDGQESVGPVANVSKDKVEQHCWTKPTEIEDKSREEEFDNYLEDLLL